MNSFGKLQCHAKVNQKQQEPLHKQQGLHLPRPHKKRAPANAAKTELSSKEQIKQQQMYSQVVKAMDRWDYLRVALI